MTIRGEARKAALSPLEEQARRPGVLPRFRHAIGLIADYFFSPQWPVAWGLFLLALLLTLGNVGSLVAMIDWQKTLFDALGARTTAAIPAIIGQFALITSFMIGTSLTSEYVQSMLKIQWRVWMTHDYARRYLADGRVYRIEQAGIVDNPDQRIAQDVEMFTRTMVDHVLGFFRFVVATVSYTVVLFHQSEPLHISLAGRQVAIPGNFVIYAWAYALFSYVVIYHVGKPLIRRTMRQQKVEADFRFRLTDIRRGAEQIAFFRAAATEWRRLTMLFARVRDNAVALLYALLGVRATQSVLGSIQDVLPILAGLPRYFAGTMTLGDLMQTRAAFANLQGSLSWITQAYPGIAETVAVLNRLHLLDEELARGTEGGIVTARGGAMPVDVRTLALTRPDGAPLLSVDHWRVAPGERWAIRGPSGAGKSTLLRAIAGLWPHGAGTVAIGDGKTMFVPQRLYMPQGTLRDILAFPAERDWVDDRIASDALEACGLGTLVDALDSHRAWERELSPGQQQLIGFARIVIHRPDILFLDEATSALDEANAQAMYRLLDARLPGLTLVSVVHDPALLDHHGRCLEIRAGVASIAA